jgi:hypothetical protein
MPNWGWKSPASEKSIDGKELSKNISSDSDLRPGIFTEAEDAEGLS